ncbi:MAG TPA: hypothetical protein DIU47_03540 [Candidatus Pacebacteria bacterium]|nr:MAG: hypothetical protein UX36_C0001G0218 [Microgenomates group bacterium GW2011_GWC1_46_15]HCR93001.1 hypothetical protein [Candidatus Paceibacterota bacterium]
MFHKTVYSIKHWKRKHEGAFWFFTLFSTWGAYFLYLWPHILYKTGEGIVAGWIGVWADWAAHFSYASVFAYRPPSAWFLWHPLFLGKKFTYPFLADAISGMLMRLGIDRVPAFIGPSIIFTALFLATLFLFYREILKSWKQAYLAVSLFLLSGGLGFLWFLRDLFQTQSLRVVQFPPLEYTHIGDSYIEWINVVTGQLLPQRAFLLGLPVALMLLIILHRWTQKGFSKVSLARLIFFGLCSSLLLIIHVHTFIMFVMVCAVSCIFALYKKKQDWKHWVMFAIAAGIPSMIIFSWLYGGEITQGFFRWYPGWLANPQAKNINFFYFWWINWGVFLPFSLFAIIKTKLYKQQFVLSGLLLFIASNLILFQPYDWDNSKILTWSYLFFCIPSAQLLAMMWRRRIIFAKVSAIVLVMVMTASGGLDLWRLLHTDKLSYLMLSSDDLSIAEQFRRISTPTDVVLTADKHNHWVTTLTGRPILLGYKGWMWTYGIHYEQRDADMVEMFRGGPLAQELLKTYAIKWVVIGPAELYDYHANEAYFAKKYPMVLKNSEYRVYKIQ